MSDELEILLAEIRACRKCADLPAGPRPVLRAAPCARILLAGQAPGIRVHETGIPWNDPSGDRLRQWLGVERDVFYDPARIAIVPMGFCYPGTGRSGDLPPRPECRTTWHSRLVPMLGEVELTICIGQYAQAWYLGDRRCATLTETVGAWRDYAPGLLPLPHPSGRNNGWLKRNPWFEDDVLPHLRARVAALLQ
ncbi:MAG: hypothetical protein TEF_05435 [Rhizobiales bacterium NRL2]|nr:MAG: hypothetical protein TEF_05435 [Rhizobiales bacterium NRL2]